MNTRLSLLSARIIIFNQCRDEKDVVKQFLEQSVNYQALKKINRINQESKRGRFANNSIFQIYYQLATDDEKTLSQLEQAKNFAQLFHAIGISTQKLDAPESIYLEKLAYVVGNFHQRINGAFYMFHLAKEVREFAAKHLYSIDHDLYQPSSTI